MESLLPELHNHCILPQCGRIALLMLSETSHTMWNVVGGFVDSDLNFPCADVTIVRRPSTRGSRVGPFGLDGVLYRIYGGRDSTDFMHDLLQPDALHASIWLHIGFKQLWMIEIVDWLFGPQRTYLVDYLRSATATLIVLGAFLDLVTRLNSIGLSAISLPYHTQPDSPWSAEMYSILIRADRLDLLSLRCPPGWQPVVRQHITAMEWREMLATWSNIYSSDTVTATIVGHRVVNVLVDYEEQIYGESNPAIGDMVRFVVMNIIMDHPNGNLARLRDVFTDSGVTMADYDWLSLVYRITESMRRMPVLPLWYRQGHVASMDMLCIFVHEGCSRAYLHNSPALAVDELVWLVRMKYVDLAMVGDASAWKTWLQANVADLPGQWRNNVCDALLFCLGYSSFLDDGLPVVPRLIRDIRYPPLSWTREAAYQAGLGKTLSRIPGLIVNDREPDKQTAEVDEKVNSGAPPCAKCEARDKPELLFTPETASHWSYRCPRCKNQVAMRKKKR